jgi:hypothetical protein
MARTLQALVDKVAVKLDVIGLGQTLADEDSSNFADDILSALKELSSREVIDISDTNVIDDDVFLALSEYLAARLSDDYGKPAADQTTLRMLEDKLKDIVAPVATQKTLKTERILRQGNYGYFRGYNPVTGE